MSSFSICGYLESTAVVPSAAYFWLVVMFAFKDEVFGRDRIVDGSRTTRLVLPGKGSLETSPEVFEWIYLSLRAIASRPVGGATVALIGLLG